MAAKVDPAFLNIPDNESCFLIWRIENFKAAAVPTKEYGSFFEGDSYIVFSQFYSGVPLGSNIKRRDLAGKKLEKHIHFWLGESTTLDESGTAAFKAVELDDYMGGHPIQHREVQGHESKMFLSYFKSKGGISYKQGGVSTGFSHMDNTIKPRLLHIKGKIDPRIKEVDISWGNMNEGDSFILDIGDRLFVWNGGQCSRMERVKAGEYARRIRDDRGKGRVVVMEQGEDSVGHLGSQDFKEFDQFLPASGRSKLQSAMVAGADDAYERKTASTLKLWRVAEESGSLHPTQENVAPLSKSMLDSGDCFIVDNGEAGIWVWCGRNASKNEKKHSMSHALEFVKQRKYPANVQVTKVPERAEPTEFKALFKFWEREKLPGEIKPHIRNRIARVDRTKFEASSLHSNQKMARETGMVDDGSGKKKIWRIERTGRTYAKVEVADKHHGRLYGGDSYIILYTYSLGAREKHIIYFWLGKRSTLDERAAAATFSTELDHSLGGAPEQVRVVHGKEPNHFMAMFDGKLIIYTGGKAGWGQEKDVGPGDTFLLHVRGTSSLCLKAEQVPLDAESLNSNDCFVLVNKKEAYVWTGKGSSDDEKQMAQEIAASCSSDVAMVTEGKETTTFWNLIGGEKEYGSASRLGSISDLEEHPPRLFQCSNASGRFIADEIVNFVQQDLDPDDVFLLDTYDDIYLWIGSGARAEEKTMSQDMAIEYLKSDPSGRDEDTAIYMVKQNEEPPTFTGWFGVWDRELLEQSSSTNFEDVAKYPYEKLTGRGGLPSNVDMLNKERHLTEMEFRQRFQMSHKDFATLPSWKQRDLKKRENLF